MVQQMYIPTLLLSIIFFAGAMNAQDCATIETEKDKAGKVHITIDKGDSGGITVIEENKDTVYIFRKSCRDDERKGLRRGLGRLREKGWGGSGGPCFGAFALSMDPINEVIETDDLLRHYTFSINDYFEPVFMQGGKGYGGLGNGLRLGGGGMEGILFFPSKNAYQDSAVDLEIEIQYGGFLIEKAWVIDKLNYTAGTYLGSGSITLNAVKYSLSERTNFENEIDDDEAQKAKARFFSMEIHGGFTYSFFPLVHIGMDMALPFFFSSKGFERRSSDFFSVNPGLQAKIMFGTLG
ncbi:MAG: hypothetical protein GF401_02930 [Chitinivibrionales bacterium]|nr:hypothetical protein [Chitinivibrionales bacterium]